MQGCKKQTEAAASPDFQNYQNGGGVCGIKAQPLKFCHAREALEPVAAGASSEGKDPLTG
jgi:hypothetical protein